MSRVLGIETSCDETSAAVLRQEGRRWHLESLVVSSQIEWHRPYGGVVPEVATRQHLRCLDGLVAGVLADAGVDLARIDAVAATSGPGLASSLLIGSSYANGLALAAGRPVFAVNHLEGHVVSPFLTQGRCPEYPHLSLIASGGHTLLLRADGPGRIRRLGTTRDDAAGEAFDKVAKLLGLAYPGGPEIERRATGGDAEAVAFPRSLLEPESLDFSFSGLKTSVRVALQRRGGPPQGRELDDWCASFQAAVADVLEEKARRALRREGVGLLTFSGGVACNRVVRSALAGMAHGEGAQFLPAAPEFCTDNAAMIAAVGAQRLEAGAAADFPVEVCPTSDI